MTGNEERAAKWAAIIQMLRHGGLVHGPGARLFGFDSWYPERRDPAIAHHAMAAFVEEELALRFGDQGIDGSAGDQVSLVQQGNQQAEALCSAVRQD